MTKPKPVVNQPVKTSFMVEPKLWQAFRGAAITKGLTASELLSQLMQTYLTQWKRGAS